ncbi:lipopolysaccharide N-acetylmannosaminouronosyltransferase [Erwinia sp. OLTSP20]|nr:lipopolysaccharide N-acetylmannosaminouronosyltransferase [Erwinia sp. OLFS4]PIJ50824.1 lipopolysaccharide N-acetylmannosaminouronosyltransferase [Erwinia sp. OAMSP11]PIJ72970.1 lipopolysaccharide N-acetylmannosaminouronosyltransferase [Erwinia sp. OLSSP12]PIJ81991.1 lipopolysaccharide N-acetylmannosaminouronosyltransferase [Erwinia sp. OLCASP19]PIJ84646.1 lipopolysaccharide N-acetylmannosaminouronosyltransferase [Erwinia sp. OLMTSP26]PIJ86995.1 lipopolysaccharide N-acetylmannosaminouronosy
MQQGEEPPVYTIRGVRLAGFASRKAFIAHLITDRRWLPGILVAINAEKMLTIEQDRHIGALIDAARYRYADGISMVRAIHRKYPQARVERIAGADLWEGIMERAGENGSRVFLVGATPEVLRMTAEKLQQRWQVNIVGTQDGYFADDQQDAIFARIAASGAEIVTVAMGSPKQEVFMCACQALYPQALYMGVGGTYDVFTGRVRRAPVVWQNLGLEWLYRLIRQPSRIGRLIKMLTFLRWYFRREL